MSKLTPTNIAASINQRLLNKAKAENRQHNEVLQYYVMERFLYRLSQSNHAENLILKGALMFIAWDVPQSRATRDIDLLGKTNNSPENISKVFREILEVGSPRDGLVFSPASISIQEIQKDRDYRGSEVTFAAKLGPAKIILRVDIGFDDVVHPQPQRINYPTLLNEGSVEIWGYTQETVVAEKFHALIQKGSANSRRKDFFDLWYLSNQFEFTYSDLRKALEKTFEKRSTKLTITSPVFDEAYSENPINNTEWQRYLERTGLLFVPGDLKTVMSRIYEFISPVATENALSHLDDSRWLPGAGWVV